MRAELIETTACKKTLAVEVPSDTVQEEFEKITREYTRVARISGFRPGKVPTALVRRRFYNEIKEEVFHRLIPKSYDQAVQQRGLKPLSEPKLDRVEFEEGQALRFEATFEVLPEISLPDYKGLEAAQKEEPVTEPDVEEVLRRLRENAAQYVPVENREVQEGDFALVNVRGKVGETGREIVENNVLLEVGGKNTEPAFTERLRGMRVGEAVDFEVLHSNDPPGPKGLAGKQVTYHLELAGIKEKILPALDDDFPKDLGELGTLVEFRQKIRRDMEEQSRLQAVEAARDSLVQSLSERTSFELPESLVERKLDAISHKVAANLASQGVDLRRTKIDWQAVRDKYREPARREVRRDLILQEIARREGLEVAEEEMEGELERIARSSHQSVVALKASLKREERLEEIRTNLLRKKALDLLHEHAKIMGGVR
ncbi:MAG: trigger factor [Acidobacteria bacterium]|nr:trigger factor [Acidobacteriota bacterium]